jgi:hypothetical protein
MFSGLPSNAYVADIRQNTTSVYDSGILIGDKTPEPLEILLSTNGGTVQGTVYTSDKKVFHFDCCTGTQSGHRQNTELFKTVTSDSLGQFAISGVRPNDYKTSRVDNIPPGASQTPSFVAKYEAQGSTVRVAAGSRITAEFHSRTVGEVTKVIAACSPAL